MMNLLMRSYSEVCLGLIFWLLGFDGLIYCDFDANFYFYNFVKVGVFPHLYQMENGAFCHSNVCFDDCVYAYG
jgi:hypothetical protein